MENGQDKEFKQINIIEALSLWGCSLGILKAPEVKEGQDRNVSVEDDYREFDVDDAEAVLQSHLERKGPHKKRDVKMTREQKKRKDLAEKPAPQRPRVLCKYYTEGLCHKVISSKSKYRLFIC